MDNLESMNQNRMKSKEDIYKKRSEFNTGVGYNILNSAYNKSEKGSY